MAQGLVWLCGCGQIPATYIRVAHPMPSYERRSLWVSGCCPRRPSIRWFAAQASDPCLAVEVYAYADLDWTPAADLYAKSHDDALWRFYLDTAVHFVQPDLTGAVTDTVTEGGGGRPYFDSRTYFVEDVDRDLVGRACTYSDWEGGAA